MIATLALLTISSFEATAPLPEAARELGSTISAGRRVLELTDTEPKIVDPPDPEPRAGRPDDRPASGSRPAIPGSADPTFTGPRPDRSTPAGGSHCSGASGTGKTTVVSLLLRFLDPDAGRVSVGGVDARAPAPDTTSDRRSPSPARTPTCSARRSPPTSGSPGPMPRTPSSGLRSRRHGSRSGSARSPTALDTFVGEGGRELSGGQRGRLIVARALLSPAPVLLLDEPTAHLDPADRRAADRRHLRSCRRAFGPADHPSAGGPRPRRRRADDRGDHPSRVIGSESVGA